MMFRVSNMSAETDASVVRDRQPQLCNASLKRVCEASFGARLCDEPALCERRLYNQIFSQLSE